MNLMMSGLSKILRLLQNIYFNLVATISGALYTCRAAIVRLSSTLLSVAQSAVSTWRAEHLIWTQTYTDVVQTVKSSAIYSTTLRLISLFGSLVITIILIGFTSLSFMMGLIVVGVSKLVVMMRGRFTTK